jgi:hypothetical protein
MLHIATIWNSVVLSVLAALHNSWHMIKTKAKIVVQTINKHVEIDTLFQSLSIFCYRF